jgi:cell division protein FtsQ
MMGAFGGPTHRSRRLTLWALGLAVVATIGLGAWAVWWSALLEIRRVEVVGIHRLSADEVRAAAEVPMGRPLARLDAGGVSRRVQTISQVADVAVVRHWPHTVRIVVQERMPAVAVAGDGGFVLLDGTGFAFDTTEQPPSGVPLVVGADATSLGQDRVNAVVETLAAVPPAVRAKVTEIAAPSAEAVTLTMKDGVHIIWGGARDGPRKAEVLTALMHTKAKLYDVSSPDAPVTSG